MKNIYTILICLLLSAGAFAANLTATSIAAGFGKKNGKINLVISGGFMPYSISWSGPGGYASTKLNPDSLAAGTYCVTVTDNYCGVAKLCINVTESANSITELSAEKINVFPNPFADELFIELSGSHTGNASFTLHDLNGKLVATHQTSVQQQIHWKLGQALASGAYILNISLEDGTVIRTQINSAAKQ